MNQSNSSKQVLLSVIGVAILVVAVVGVSFAFFNYTRTGEANTVRTGTIYFNTSYDKINVSNLFPTSRATALAASTAQEQASVVGITEITVDGYTTYANGVDYVVVVDGFTNGTTVTGTPSVPISVNVSATGTGTGVYLAGTVNSLQAITLNGTTKTPGFGASYGNNDANALSLISYEANQTATSGPVDFVSITDGAILAQGHIAPVDGVNASTAIGLTGRTHGTIVIKAYIDSKLVAISDTLAEDVGDNNGGTDGRIVQGNDENGTPATWVAGRKVFTTAQWNSFQSAGVSFRIKVIANEGNDTAFNSATVNTITPLANPVAAANTGL